ncbi:MAG: PEP-CTERM sorting domain-containing protein [Akkermansia sp.]|nr:PEP-CTERM sorting domain-containing protein [Akkermansia sp.]
MKKTLIALFAMSGIAFGLTATEVASSITLDGTQSTDSRLDMKYNDGDANQTIITSVDNVTIYGIDGYGLNTANASLTFDIANKLTATDAIKLPTVVASSNIYVKTAITDAELTSLETIGQASRWIVEADIIHSIGAYVTNNHLTLTLSGLSGYANGGFIFDCNGKYYAASDVSFSGNYATVSGTATELELADGTLYTTLKITATEGASVKGIGYLATATVPEPTTATLSLLALAGLAARRRRK